MAKRVKKTSLSLSMQQEADLELLITFTGRTKAEHFREAIAIYLKDQLDFFTRHKAERKLLGLDDLNSFTA